ncbi:transposase [Streptomyces sp. NPDC088350]|uniref:transposase n=1 Tax=Streptomyces sp. NPDC088350 TaxID=3365854 RepID=UPI00382C00F6
MLVCDGLRGLPDAVETVWSRATVQTCVVTSCAIRSVTRPVRTGTRSPKHSGPYTQPPSEDAATERFGEFQETWGRRYPAIRSSASAETSPTRPPPSSASTWR